MYLRKLEKEDGNLIFINPYEIVSVEPPHKFKLVPNGEDLTCINMKGGHHVHVKGTVENVLKKLEIMVRS